MLAHLWADLSDAILLREGGLIELHMPRSCQNVTQDLHHNDIRG